MFYVSKFYLTVVQRLPRVGQLPLEAFPRLQRALRLMGNTDIVDTDDEGQAFSSRLAEDNLLTSKNWSQTESPGRQRRQHQRARGYRPARLASNHCQMPRYHHEIDTHYETFRLDLCFFLSFSVSF